MEKVSMQWRGENQERCAVCKTSGDVSSRETNIWVTDGVKCGTEVEETEDAKLSVVGRVMQIAGDSEECSFSTVLLVETVVKLGGSMFEALETWPRLMVEK